MTRESDDEVERLRVELAEAKARIAELEGMAEHDVLVPVLNRRGFLHEVERALGLAERYGTPSALVYIDLVGFKRVNDTFGHIAGDRALIQVGQVLVASTRQTDAVGRLGGDEFGVALTHCDLTTGERIAARLVRVIAANAVEHGGERINITASVGVTDIGAAGDALLALEQADRAMYAARRIALRA